MRAAIFNPYLDTLGGGERYTLAFAKVLLESGFEVDLEWKDPEILPALKNRFGIRLDGVGVVPDIKRGDGYDLCFWVSDGSIPALKARRNILHFQVPFREVNGASLVNKMKLFRINKIICNSLFTKKIIDKEYGVVSDILYPPVDTEGIKPKRKEDIILSVGRFSGLLQSKRQEVLIKVFMDIYDKGFKDWKLVLAGGVEVGNSDYTIQLRDLAKGYPVEIVESPDYPKLKNLYGISKIFWSASGFGEDENVHPEKVEHFGIAVVESMSGGCVPMAYNAGGHKEIIEPDKNGILWTDPNELEKQTLNLLNNKSLMRNYSKSAGDSSTRFSYNNFKENILSFLK